MSSDTHDEHDDDLEPEVIVGAEIETEIYPEDEDQEESRTGRDMTNPTGRAEAERQPAVNTDEGDDAGDTI